MVSSVISEIFDKICFAPPILRLVFAPSTLTTAYQKRKTRVKYFFENYIYVEFHQNR